MAMKKIIAVILALVVCVAGMLFGADCASAFVIGGCFPPAYMLTTVPGYIPTLSCDVYGSVVGSVVGQSISHDLSKVAGSYWDCFRGPTIEPPTVVERPKGIWSLISAMMTLIVAFIAELIW